MGKRKRGSRRLGCVAILLVVISSVVALGLVIQWAFSATSAVGDAANAFMVALRENDPDAAFALMSESLQDEIGNAENIYAALNGRTPQDWQFNSFSVRNNVGTVTGSVTFTDGSERVVRIRLDTYEGQWWVSGFSF
jgi:hypothetical protein